MVDPGKANHVVSVPALQWKRERLRAQREKLRAELLEVEAELASHSPATKEHSKIHTQTGEPKTPTFPKLVSTDVPDLEAPHSGDDDPLIGRTLQRHESGKGLKHRRHGNSPTQIIKGHILPTVFLQPRRLNQSHQQGPTDFNSLPLGETSSEHTSHELTSFLKSNDVAPRTPETLTSSTATGGGESDCHGVTSFRALVQDRAGWLVGLLVLQSMSSFIISRNEKLLQNHVVIVRFLTMLVGAGGNAGNQASVGVIRGLATGSVNDQNTKETLIREVKMGLALSTVLGLAGAARAALFLTPLAETLAITTSLVAIVFLSILLGAALPLLMKYVQIDPAHSSTTIQVVMDILGVTITVHVCGAVLDSALSKWVTGL